MKYKLYTKPFIGYILINLKNAWQVTFLYFGFFLSLNLQASSTCS